MLASDQVVKFPAAVPLQDITRQNILNYFRDGHWGQALELLSHLCLHSDQHIIVMGPSGIGKTTMKQALEKRCIPNLHIVDDADSLAIDQIERLLEEPSQKVVLFAKPLLLNIVRQSTLTKAVLAKIRIVEIEPLALHELAGFLQHLWLAAGNEGVVVCDKKRIRRIFALTKGNPGLVKKLFSKQMLANMLRGRSMSEERGSGRVLSPFVVGLATAVGLGLCVLALMWPSNKVESEVHKLPTPQTLVAEVPVINVAEQEFDVMSVVDEDQDKKLLELEQKMLLLQEKILQEQQPLTEKIAITDGKAAAPAVAVLPEPTKNATAKLTKTNLKRKTKSNFSRDEQAILSVDKKRYTLQLVAASNEQRIKDFIRDNKLSGKAKYFVGKRKGKLWYTVIYGDFADKQSALASAQKLPDAVKKLEPWARQYVHIHDTINKNYS